MNSRDLIYQINKEFFEVLTIIEIRPDTEKARVVIQQELELEGLD